MPLIVTGTIGLDTIETPGQQVQAVLGGSGMYFSAAASFFGRVRLVAAVGEDFPEEHRKGFATYPNIDTRGLEIRKGSKTFRWGGKYLADMNHRETLFTELGILVEAPPAIPSGFADSDCVFLANMMPSVQRGLLEALPQHKIVVADTMDLWINTAKADLLVLMRKLDGLVLNYDEAELLTGKKNPVTAGRHILDMGPKFVVIKKGEHGCLLIHREGIGALPAYPTEQVVDPTGCGDSFAGGMMGWLANQKGNLASFDSIRQSLAYGTVVASFTIEEFSLNRLKRLNKAELDARLKEYTSMVRV